MLDALFTPRPKQWGLRGDPHLWDAMRDAARDTAPDTIEDINLFLADLYEDLVGRPLTTDDAPVSTPAFHSGGMSSGMVSPRFWREDALPLLAKRFREHNTAPPPKKEAPLWWSRETSAFYAIPEGTALPEGALRIWRLSGDSQLADADALDDFIISGDEAGRRIARAVWQAPSSSRQKLRSLLQMAQSEGGKKVDVDAIVGGLEGLLKGSGIMERVQEAGQKAREKASEVGQDAKPAQAELRATLGRLGSQLQALGQRLQTLNDTEESP